MTLKILSGGAANGLVTALSAPFQAKTGMGIAGDYGAVGGMYDRIVAGEDVDCIILTRALVDQLARSGHVRRETVRDVGGVVTGVAIRDGAPAVDVSTPDALARALSDADGIYVADMAKSTAGKHVASVLSQLGLTEKTKDRISEYPNGQTAMAKLAEMGTDASIGCTQVTEILNTAGVAYVAALPAPLGLETVYTAAVSSRAAYPDAASQLIAILTDPAHAKVRAGAGFS